jgi:hypothetical protein
MKSRLAAPALSNAVVRRGQAASCILHTDRGSQDRMNPRSKVPRKPDTLLTGLIIDMSIV